MSSRIPAGHACSRARSPFAATLAAAVLVAASAGGETLFVSGGTIHPVSGPPIANAALLVVDGTISALGAGLAAPAGATVVDATGKHVYPGFVHPATQLGLTEIGSVRGTVDTTETGDFNPHLRVEVAFNADSQLLPPALAGGVLTAHVVSRGDLFAGSTAAMRLDGWNWRDMTMSAPVALSLFVPEVAWFPKAGEDAKAREEFEKKGKAAWKRLDDLWARAKAYDVARRAAAAGTGPAIDLDPPYEALRGLVAGETLLLLHADERNQIARALDWSQQAGIARRALVASSDAQYLAERLAREQVPVILTEVLALPTRRWEPYDAVYRAAGELHRAGVQVAIGDGADASNARNLPFQAAMAAAFGLPPDEALASVTLRPAEILGIADRVGSLAVGKEGSFFVADGDPLEIRTRIERVFVRGRELDLGRDRQRQLYERYRSRPRPTDSPSRP